MINFEVFQPAAFSYKLRINKIESEQPDQDWPVSLKSNILTIDKWFNTEDEALDFTRTKEFKSLFRTVEKYWDNQIIK